MTPDKAVSFQLTLDPLEAQLLREVTLQTLDQQGWQDKDVNWRRTLGHTVATGSLRLRAGVLAIRCRVDSVFRNIPSFTRPLYVDVRTAPPILMLFSMGGASGIDPPVATGDPNNQAELEKHGIRVNEDLCRRRGIDATLIATLTTNRNVQCNTSVMTIAPTSSSTSLCGS